MSDNFDPKVGGSTSPEWWVNMDRNGGSTWSGIYNATINDKDFHLTVKNNKTKPSIDFRPRMQIKPQIKNFGFPCKLLIGTDKLPN
ncbi:MAG: hypothetical protein ACTHOB_17485 [Ginsengibacter sp.]